MRIPIWKGLAIEIRLSKKRSLSREEEAYLHHTFIHDQAGYEIRTSVPNYVRYGDVLYTRVGGRTLPSETNIDVQHLPDDA